MTGSMEFRLGRIETDADSGRATDEPGALRLLVLGDFSGRGQCVSADSGGSLAERPLWRVDADNFAARLARCGPRWICR